MSRYGINYYNLAYYGPDNASQYIATSFTAKPRGYKNIQIKWNSPAGTWSKLRLVRNSFGFPVNPWDGDLLTEAAIETDPTIYDDTFQLVEGSYYYYSLFVFETVTYTWIRVGDASGVSVKDYGYIKGLYEGLPEIARIKSAYDASGNYDNTDLYNFISLFAFELSYTHTVVNLLNNKYDVQKCNGALIPLFLQQLGYDYEKEIGYQQSRILVRDAVQINKEKGSSQGLREFIKAFAGYAVTKPVGTEPNPSVDGLTMGHNLMLDYNDSSFEEGIGHWGSLDGTASLSSIRTQTVRQASIASNVATITLEKTHGYRVGDKFTTSNFPLNLFNTTTNQFTITAVAAKTISFSLTGADVPITDVYNKVFKAYPTISPYPAPWIEPTSSTFTPNKRKGVLSVKNVSGSPATIKFECGYVGGDITKFNPLTRGIPVTAGLDYSFSGYSITGGSARSVVMGINWYNRFGTLLSDSAGTGSNNATGEFVSGSRKFVTAEAPAGAYYAVPTIQIASAAGGEFHYFDALQFEQDENPTTFDEARQIHLTIKATRINELKNPNFASPIAPWTASNSTNAIDTTSQEPGVSVFTIARAAILDSVVTLTLTVSHDFKVNDVIAISGSTWVGADLNGTYTVTAGSAGKIVTFAKSAANQTEADASGSIFLSGNALLLTATGSSVVLKSWDGTTNGELMPIHYPNTQYTFSLYAQGLNTADTLTPSIKWYASDYSQIGSAVSGRVARLTASITDVSGRDGLVTYQAQNNFTVGQVVSITGITMISGTTYNLSNVTIISATEDQFIVRSGANGLYNTGGTATPTVTAKDWIRPYVTATAPATAAYAAVEVAWATANTRTVKFDSALFENSAGLLDYFDGSNGPCSPADLYWEGNSTNSARSHLYKNRFAVISRLIGSKLPENVVTGTPVSVYLAQPQT